MTPDKIQKDREAGTLDDLNERVNAFSTLSLPGQMPMMHMGTSYLVNDLWKAVRTLTAENAALEARVAELETALHPFSKTAGEMFSRNWEKDDVALKFVTKGKAFIVTFSDFLNAHAALEKSHE